MKRKYIKVRPSREPLNPDDIVEQLSSLHNLKSREKSPTLKDKLNPLKDSSEFVPVFEFLAVSQGKESPVEFFYGTAESYVNVLKNKLTSAFPSSFDIEVVEVDILEKIIPPEQLAPKDFVKKYEDGKLLFSDDVAGTPEDISGESWDSEDLQTADGGGPEQNQGGGASVQESNDLLHLDIAQPSETTKASDEDAVTSNEQQMTLNSDQIENMDMLKEIDATLPDLVSLPTELDADPLKGDIDGPTWTKKGDILARPSLEHGAPIATEWYGKGERKKDWMTTVKMFSKITQPESDDIQDRAPLATLIQHLSDSDYPIAFQVVFKRVEDWTREAEKRKDDLHLNRDTLAQKVKYEVGEVVFGPSRERRRERARDHFEDVGESADMGSESPIVGDVGKRRSLIDNKIPGYTFRTNIRAVAVANEHISEADMRQTMEDLSTTLDHIDGYFYGTEPEIITDDGSSKEATKVFHQLINREIATGSGKRRPDMIFNADELGNFVSVPCAENLTVDGVRSTRAEAKARDPLPKPHDDLMQHFHRPGMRIGQALDKNDDPEPVPTQIPPKLLKRHYGRFGATGAGKSKSLINDILSLHENTSGPVILIDPKGDGMPENYMKSHFERYGEEDFKENVIHYPIPEIMPGFTFFNIEPALEQGVRREDAIQNKADHYQELLKMVMGKESYEDSKVAPTIISALIKTLFNEHYVNQKTSEGGDSLLNDRESPNKFTHQHLEKLAKELRLHGLDEGGELPEPDDEAVKDTLEEQTKGDAHTFSTIMNAVTNRLNYIREDEHLRKIFNNTERKFDFRDHLQDDKVILFDLGHLRDDATMVIAGLILTNLWDALQEADRTVCTQGHGSIQECRRKAKRNGLDSKRLDCREEWSDDHLVNIIIDEAASVAISDIMDKMLEQGRSFHLSVGLSMQFPEQMKGASSIRTYKNVLNNVATKLIAKITLDEEIAKAMAHEGMSIEEFDNRIKALPPGEWIAQLPSPQFMQTGPEPFSLKPLPIPAGHPESDYVLTDEANRRFYHYLDNHVHKQTKEKYAIDRDKVALGSGSPNQNATSIEPDNSSGSTSDSTASADGGVVDQQKGESDTTTPADNAESDDYESTKLNEVAVPGVGEGDVPEDGDTEVTTGGGFQQSFLTDIDIREADLPAHKRWTGEVILCDVCDEDYFVNEWRDAMACCHNEIAEMQALRDAQTNLRSRYGDEGYISTEWSSHSEYLEAPVRATLSEEYVKEGEKIPTNATTITKLEDIAHAIGDDRTPETIGGVLKAVNAAIPPEYHYCFEGIVEWLIKELELIESELGTDIELNESYFTELLAETPPADVEVRAAELLDSCMQHDIDVNVVAKWSGLVVDDIFKSQVSGPRRISGTRWAHTGKYASVYSDQTGLGKPVSQERELDLYDLPDAEYIHTDRTDKREADVLASPMPIKPVSVENPDTEQMQKYGIDKSDVDFLAAVFKAAYGKLDGYCLLDSMRPIRDMYGVDDEELAKKGLIKKHIGINKRFYYTVTPEGRDVCNVGGGIGGYEGDIGEETAHRVGVGLVTRYLEMQDGVERVEQYERKGENVLDVIAYCDENKVEAVVEVEAGIISADVGETVDLPGSNNYESIRKDLEAMAKVGGEGLWVTRNREVLETVMRALIDDLDIPESELNKIGDSKYPIKEVNEMVEKRDVAGFDRVFTYSHIRGMLEG